MNKARMLGDIHPGEVLLEEFMVPKGISPRQLAGDIGVPVRRVRAVVHRGAPIAADFAVRLGQHFAMDPRFWMNLQIEYEVRLAKRREESGLATPSTKQR